MLKVTEPTHVTRAGWERLYRQHQDTDTLALGIFDHPVASRIHWDILQLDPQVGPQKFPEEQEQQLRALWYDYVRGMPRMLPKKRNYCHIGLFGEIPVLRPDADSFAGKVKVILESLNGDRRG